VAKDVIEKKCRLEGKKTHNAAMAKAVAEQLMEAVDAAERQSKEKKNDNLYHFGHDFLAEVSKAILALEAKATEKEANKKTGKK